MRPKNLPPRPRQRTPTTPAPTPLHKTRQRVTRLPQPTLHRLLIAKLAIRLTSRRPRQQCRHINLQIQIRVVTTLAHIQFLSAGFLGAHTLDAGNVHGAAGGEGVGAAGLAGF